MGKQYKVLSEKDIAFIKEQKMFYIASSSGKEVNLSPKGYDSIRVLDNTTLLYLDYTGSGNRTYTDAAADGEFTLVFNAFEGKPIILRLFCKASVVSKDTPEFKKYLELFGEKESLVRHLFSFKIYALESSCGMSVPFMEYKGERDELKDWMCKMDDDGKLKKYQKDHFTPPDLKKI